MGKTKRRAGGRYTTPLPLLTPSLPPLPTTTTPLTNSSHPYLTTHYAHYTITLLTTSPTTPTYTSHYPSLPTPPHYAPLPPLPPPPPSLLPSLTPTACVTFLLYPFYIYIYIFVRNTHTEWFSEKRKSASRPNFNSIFVRSCYFFFKFKKILVNLNWWIHRRRASENRTPLFRPHGLGRQSDRKFGGKT